VSGGHAGDFPDWTSEDPDLITEYIEDLIDRAAKGDTEVLTGVDPEDGTKAIKDTATGIIVGLGNQAANRVPFAFKPKNPDYFDTNFSGKPGR
jgi:hypothetical protein